MPSRETLLFVLGLAVALVPISGLPLAVKTPLILIAGLVIALLALSLRVRAHRYEQSGVRRRALITNTPASPERPARAPRRVEPRIVAEHAYAIPQHQDTY